LDLKSFDWRSLQKYLQPQAANDLNAFLERLPQTAGNQILIMAAVAWSAAGMLGLYTFIQTQKLIELRTNLKDAKAVQPIVPKIKDVAVPQTDVAKYAKELADIYRGISIKSQGSSIQITAADTARFAEFREAVGHVQNGGSGWRVSVDRLCVGRECDKDKLAVLLKINKVSVDKPTIK
jgi:hypothetical protein